MNNYTKLPPVEQASKPTRKKRKFKMTPIILGIVLILALGYIGYGFYSDYSLGLQQKAFVEGANYITFTYMQTAVKCEPIPLQINENVTLQLIAIECLQQGDNNGQ